MTSRGGGATNVSRAKKAGAWIKLPSGEGKPGAGGPFEGRTVRIQGLTRNGARVTVSGMGEGPNTQLITKTELQNSTVVSAPRRGR